MGASRKRARPRSGGRGSGGGGGGGAAAAKAPRGAPPDGAAAAASSAYAAALLSSIPAAAAVVAKGGLTSAGGARAAAATAADGAAAGAAAAPAEAGGAPQDAANGGSDADTDGGADAPPPAPAAAATPYPTSRSAAASALAAADAAAAAATPGAGASAPAPSPLAKAAKVIVVLENANLETVKPSAHATAYQLLNSDDHVGLLRKTRRDANTHARPDITHQCLLALMDSPLNKAGHLAVYIRSVKGVLIRVHPETRIPRTAKRFAGLMVELLHKLKVRSTGGSTPLLQVVANPITSHLPVGCKRVLCSYHTENVVDMRAHALASLRVAPPPPGGGESEAARREREGAEVSVCYVIGAMAHGKVDADWVEETICVSEYTLSAATVCSRLVYAYECALGVL